MSDPVRLTKRQREVLAGIARPLGLSNDVPLGSRCVPYHALRYAGLIEFYSHGGSAYRITTSARLTPAGRAYCEAHGIEAR
jgi:hypothetical protein